MFLQHPLILFFLLCCTLTGLLLPASTQLISKISVEKDTNVKLELAFTELQVFQPGSNVNVAVNQQYSASSSDTAIGSSFAGGADGNVETFFNTIRNNSHYWRLTFKRPVCVSKVVLYARLSYKTRMQSTVSGFNTTGQKVWEFVIDGRQESAQWYPPPAYVSKCTLPATTTTAPKVVWTPLPLTRIPQSISTVAPRVAAEQTVPCQCSTVIPIRANQATIFQDCYLDRRPAANDTNCFFYFHVESSCLTASSKCCVTISNVTLFNAAFLLKKTVNDTAANVAFVLQNVHIHVFSNALNASSFIISAKTLENVSVLVENSTLVTVADVSVSTCEVSSLLLRGVVVRNVLMVIRRSVVMSESSCYSYAAAIAGKLPLVSNQMSPTITDNTSLVIEHQSVVTASGLIAIAGSIWHDQSYSLVDGAEFVLKNSTVIATMMCRAANCLTVRGAFAFSIATASGSGVNTNYLNLGSKISFIANKSTVKAKMNYSTNPWTGCMAVGITSIGGINGGAIRCATPVMLLGAKLPLTLFIGKSNDSVVASERSAMVLVTSKSSLGGKPQIVPNAMTVCANLSCFPLDICTGGIVNILGQADAFYQRFPCYNEQVVNSNTPAPLPSKSRSPTLTKTPIVSVSGTAGSLAVPVSSSASISSPSLTPTADGSLFSPAVITPSLTRIITPEPSNVTFNVSSTNATTNSSAKARTETIAVTAQPLRSSAISEEVKESGKIAFAMASVVSPKTATVAATTATTAAAVGGAISPGAASKASNMANILEVMSCEFQLPVNEDADVSASQVGLVWKLGGGRYAGFYGPILSLNGFAILLLLGNSALFKTAPTKKTVRLGFGLLCSVAMSFFLPTAVGLSSRVLFHPIETLSYVFGLVGLALSFGCALGPLRVIHAEVVKAGVIQNAESQKWMLPGPDKLSFGFRYFYDPARNPNLPLHSLAFFEDLLVAFAMSIVGSIRPPPGSLCWLIGALLAIIAVIHLLFLLTVKPFRTKMDSWFSLGIAILQAALSILVAVAVKVPSVTKIVIYIAFVLGGSFAVQTVTMLLWTLYLWKQRRARAKIEKEKSSDSLAVGMLNVEEDDITLLNEDDAEEMLQIGQVKAPNVNPLNRQPKNSSAK